MQYVFGLFLLLSTSAFAGDWFCEDEAAQKSQNFIRTCGVGEGVNEDLARYEAFKNAKMEFDFICLASSDCKNHKVNLEPKRTSCKPFKDGFKCYRLLVFQIVEE